MDTQESLPDISQMSVLVAMIMLAYAVTPFVDFTGQSWEFDLFGTVFPIELDFRLLVSLIVAAMAATGVDWLLRSHPRYTQQNLTRHQLIPAITAWVIGVPLGTIQMGMQWWVVFAFGTLLLIAVFVAEYIVTDMSDERFTVASVGLTAVSFALFLFLSISAKGAGLRLFLIFPMLSITIGLVTLRTLYLRVGEMRSYHWAAVITIIVGQVAVGLHYWPVSPVSFGLVLMAPAYGLTSLAGAIEEEGAGQTYWVEPAVMVVALLLLAFFFRNW
jgi:hypothetical protein